MRFRTRAWAAAFFALALVLTVRAQAPAPANEDIVSLRAQAEAGNAQAQFALGNHYFNVTGVPPDYAQALIWYSKSAAQGYAPAQNQLGYMHQHKFGRAAGLQARRGVLPFSREPGLCACRVQSGGDVQGWPVGQA